MILFIVIRSFVRLNSTRFLSTRIVPMGSTRASLIQNNNHHLHLPLHSNDSMKPTSSHEIMSLPIRSGSGGVSNAFMDSGHSMFSKGRLRASMPVNAKVSYDNIEEGIIKVDASYESSEDDEGGCAHPFDRDDVIPEGDEESEESSTRRVDKNT